MHILLTRPLEDCSEMILKLKNLGHQISHLPLLKIEAVQYEKINLTDFNAIIFTSANADRPDSRLVISEVHEFEKQTAFDSAQDAMPESSSIPLS